MVGRRVLIGGAGAALFARFSGFGVTAAAADAPLFRFGIVADPQYAPAVPDLKRDRHYSNSLGKLAEAVRAFNREDLAFVATLGDIIDRSWESYAHILPIYDGLTAPRVFLLGNRDHVVAPEYLASLVRNAGMPAAHYDFSGGGWRFVVLDGNEGGVFAHPPGSAERHAAEARLAEMAARGAPNAAASNGAMGEVQFAWLEATLARARDAEEKTIVMGHYPIYPLARPHNQLDDARLVALLERFPNVVAYFNGHDHAGAYAEHAGRHYLNFCGMVQTVASNAFAVVEVWPDRLQVRGFGREPSRTLAIAAG